MRALPTPLLMVAILASLAIADVPPQARSAFDKAEIAREKGLMAEAVGLYQQAIEAHPLYWEAHAGFMASMRTSGDFAPGVRLYEKLVGEHAGNVDLLALQAASGLPTERLPKLVALSDAHGENGRVWLELGRTYLALARMESDENEQRNKLKDAEKALKSAIKYDAGAAAHVLLGDAYMAGEKYRTALKEYGDALSTDADYIPGHLRKALCLHKLEKSADAIKVLGALVAEDSFPQLVAGHWLLAVISNDLGKYEDALASVEKILAIDTGDSDALVLKAFVLLDAGRPFDAATIFNQMASESPSGDVLFCLGWAYEKASDAPDIQEAQRKERLAKAAEAYERCTEMDPSVRPRDSLGFAQLLLGSHSKALSSFKRASDIDPTFAPAVNNLGLAHDMADNRAQAKRNYERVLEKIDKDNARAHVMLGLDLWMDGSAPKAIKEFEKALKIKPNDDLTWTFLGDVHYDNGKVQKAIDAYEKAVEINDRNFFAWYHMGICFEEDKNKLEDAERCYQKAHEAKIDPPVDLLLRLGDLNDVGALNRPEKAIAYLQSYVDAGGTAEWVPARIEELKELLAKK